MRIRPVIIAAPLLAATLFAGIVAPANAESAPPDLSRYACTVSVSAPAAESPIDTASAETAAREALTSQKLGQGIPTNAAGKARVASALEKDAQKLVDEATAKAQSEVKAIYAAANVPCLNESDLDGLKSAQDIDAYVATVWGKWNESQKQQVQAKIAETKNQEAADATELAGISGIVGKNIAAATKVLQDQPADAHAALRADLATLNSFQESCAKRIVGKLLPSDYNYINAQMKLGKYAPAIHAAIEEARKLNITQINDRVVARTSAARNEALTLAQPAEFKSKTIAALFSDWFAAPHPAYLNHAMAYILPQLDELATAYEKDLAAEAQPDTAAPAKDDAKPEQAEKDTQAAPVEVPSEDEAAEMLADQDEPETKIATSAADTNTANTLVATGATAGLLAGLSVAGLSTGAGVLATRRKRA